MSRLKDELESMLDEVEAELIVSLDEQQLLRLKPREYDVVLLQDVFLTLDDKQRALKTIYTSLANAGYIVLLEKKGALVLEDTYELLQHHEFRSPNNIDIVGGYDLIIGKKMHMWGAGL
jgi:predicted nicotinamide N-methyase